MKILIHKTCPTSIKLLEFLEKLGVLDKAKIIDVEKEPFYAVSLGVVHVPAIIKDDEILDFGPIKFEALEKNLDTNNKTKTSPSSYEELIEIIYEDILDNIFLALSVFLREKISIVLNYKPTINKLKKHIDAHYLDTLIKYIKENDENLYRNIEEKLVKYIAFSFIKELYWIHNRKLSIEEFNNLYTPPVFAHWVLARGSISRIGLIQDIAKEPKTKKKLLQLRQKIQEKWEQYWSKILHTE